MNAETKSPNTTPNPPSLKSARKTVSFPPSTNAPKTQSPHPADSPTHAKILSRKPTPFNSQLSATIRESGLNAVLKDDRPPAPDAPSHPERSSDAPQNGTAARDAPDAPDDHSHHNPADSDSFYDDFGLGEDIQEEEVVLDDNARAEIMSRIAGQWPPKHPQ